MHIPAEDESTAGAESIIKLVEDDGIYERSSKRERQWLEELTLQELCWLQLWRTWARAPGWS
jgi:hypothetical protein